MLFISKANSPHPVTSRHLYIAGGFFCLFVLVFLCFVGCFSMIIWTPAVLSVLYSCVLYFCIAAQMSMFHMEKHSRNTLNIIIIIRQCRKQTPPVYKHTTVFVDGWLAVQLSMPCTTPHHTHCSPESQGPRSINYFEIFWRKWELLFHAMSASRHR